MHASINLATARRIALDASGLLCPFTRGSAGALAAISQLGAVQIDTISVIERAHHHVLWSRVPGYRPETLASLEAAPRRIFEYWSHAAAYLPLGEYRFCIPRMERIKADGHQWFRADPAAVAYVRERVTAEGPLRAQDFAEPMRGPRGWWDWKPAKVALEFLFHAGELVSIGRVGFQKVYDLAERALPADLDRRFPSAAEQAARHVDRAVESLGLFSPRDVAYLRKDGTEAIPEELAGRIESGRLIALEVEGVAAASKAARADRPGAGPFLVAPSTLEAASRAERRRPRARILSPFDPAIIDRRRASRLLGLDYQLECYVPEAKRIFGYFALPIIYFDGSTGSGFIGLVDCKADRAAAVLSVRRLALFPSRAAAWAGSRRPRASALARAVSAELRRFAVFNGATRVVLGRVETEDNRLETALRTEFTAASRTVE